MTNPNLGSKRQCPKCAAKFYDFGKVAPITCPKCGKTWKEEVAKPPKPSKVKKEAVKAPVKRKLADDLDDEVLPDMPADKDDGIEDIEPVEDEEVELTSLDEVEEHEEKEEVDPNSDDAEDEMFTNMGGEKLVDDLEDHIERDEDEEDEEAEANEDDEDEDDDAPKKRR